MIKRIFFSLFIICVLFILAIVVILYQTRETPILMRIPLDHGTRKKNYCILNPFRNAEAEDAAEILLSELKNGNPEILTPYLASDKVSVLEHVISRETEYRITSWYVGDIKSKGNEIEIKYWASRDNYDGYAEEVDITLERSVNEWKVTSYGAIY